MFIYYCFHRLSIYCVSWGRYLYVIHGKHSDNHKQDRNMNNPLLLSILLSEICGHYNVIINIIIINTKPTSSSLQHILSIHGPPNRFNFAFCSYKYQFAPSSSRSRCIYYHCRNLRIYIINSQWQDTGRYTNTDV